MQTILGSGGAIGKELASALKEYTQDIRLVSRNPVKVNQTDELLKADLLDPAQVINAVSGSSIVYATVGFPYSYKIWKESWPKFTPPTATWLKPAKSSTFPVWPTRWGSLGNRAHRSFTPAMWPAKLSSTSKQKGACSPLRIWKPTRCTAGPPFPLATKITPFCYHPPHPAVEHSLPLRSNYWIQPISPV